MSLASYLARIAAFLLAFYFVEFGASYLLPENNVNILDTSRAKKSIFLTQPRMIVQGRIALSHISKKIVIVGGSNVVMGLHPNELAPSFEGVEIHNLALYGPNIRELGEVVHLVLDAVPSDSQKDLTIVMGILFTTLVNDNLRWNGGRTDIENEMLESGLYKENASMEPIPVISGDKVPYLALAMRPFLFSAYFYQQFKDIGTLTNRKFHKERDSGDNLRDTAVRDVEAANSRVVTTGDKDYALANWAKYMGSTTDWSEDGFKQLVSIANEVSSKGAKFVLLDMPLPSWHREASLYDGLYQQRLRSYLAQLRSIPGFTYLSMRDSVEDTDFYDSAHPRPKVTQRWADILAHLMKSAPVK